MAYIPHFDNGEQRLYDMRPLLRKGTVFEPLMQPENFHRVYLDDTCAVVWDIDPNIDSNAVWSNKVGLCPDSCYIDSVPVEGTHAAAEQSRYNAQTEAAMEEARAILRGEIPAKRYASVEEMRKDLDAEKEILPIQKATVYDVQRILKEKPGKAYTQEELDQILDAHIIRAER